MEQFTVRTGQNGYKQLDFTIDRNTNQHRLDVTLCDVDYPEGRNIYEIFDDHVAARQTKYVEVLYSGGADSELVLHTCLVNKTPVRAIIMRLLADNTAINTHDLYYAERYCRSTGIEHKIVDLHVDQFFGNGDHLPYLEPYLNKESHVATHLWLIEQCTGFPVVGGFYSWPWTGNGPTGVISPIRNVYSHYDQFMQDRAISGIGNMLDHSLESNCLFIQTHLDLIATGDPRLFDQQGVCKRTLKQAIYTRLGYTNIEPRISSYGWEDYYRAVFDKDSVNRALIARFGTWNHSITWQHKMAKALGSAPGTWDQF